MAQFIDRLDGLKVKRAVAPGTYVATTTMMMDRSGGIFR